MVGEELIVQPFLQAGHGAIALGAPLELPENLILTSAFRLVPLPGFFIGGMFWCLFVAQFTWVWFSWITPKLESAPFGNCVEAAGPPTEA